MLSAETKRHIDAARDVLVGVAPNPMTQIDQITYALIYKFMDDMDQAAIKAGGEPSFFVDELEPYSWSKLVDTRLGNQEKMNLYGEALQKFSEAKQLPELFRTIFRAAFLPYRSPETLGLFLKEIHYFDYSHPEELGNAYEYLLSIMSAQGDAGQFRTPRHIIDFMVDVMDPTKDDKVLDPACGTGGFLVASYNHILEKHDGKYDPEKTEKPLTPDERKKLVNNFEGYDIDPSMVQIAQVNMYLHQFKNPKIFQYDSLTSEDRWNDKFDVILANPPFMSPKGGIRPHNKFAIQSNRSEVLFVDYIANHLKPKGRAAIIVPEGIIFQSGKAYKQVRQELLDGGLFAVVSLPSGVFNPYSGVKTSILLLDEELTKQKDEILFIKVENDGFDLGATKRPITKNDLPEAKRVLNAWRSNAPTESSIALFVPKSQIRATSDFNLNGERYAPRDVKSSESTIFPLGDVIKLVFGERITKRDHLGHDYPVYGGGGESFRTDRFNREGGIVISRFAMSENCVRRVSEKFWMLDSGATVEIRKEFESLVSDKFIGYLLEYIQPQIYMCARGGAQKNLDQAQFNAIPVPIPTIEVQEQIVAQLDSKTEILQGAKKIIENWKPNFPVAEDVEIVELGDLASLEYGLGEAAQESGTHRFIRITDINSQGFLKNVEKKYITISTEDEKYVLKRGDVVIARTGATFGKCLYFEGDEPSVFAGYLIRVKPDPRLSTRYLWAFTQTQDFDTQKKRLVTGGGQPQFNANTLRKIRIPLPKIEFQEQIASLVESQLLELMSVEKLADNARLQINTTMASLWGNR